MPTTDIALYDDDGDDDDTIIMTVVILQCNIIGAV